MQWIKRHEKHLRCRTWRYPRCSFATGAARADMITGWNETTHEVLKAGRVAGGPAARTLAMVHVAMSDAVNSVRERYTRYTTTVAMMPNASAEVAAASAARDILIQLYPAQKQMIEEAYAASIKIVAGRRGQDRRRRAWASRPPRQCLRTAPSDNTSVPDTYRPNHYRRRMDTDYATDYRTVRTRQAVGFPGSGRISSGRVRRRPLPEQRSICPRLQRDEVAWRNPPSTVRTNEQSGAVKFWTQPNFMERRGTRFRAR